MFPTTTVARKCPLCQHHYTLSVPALGLRRWQSGEPVQMAFPEAPPEWREQVLTGIHPGCWDRVMGGDE
jgi:hypothetical protein